MDLSLKELQRVEKIEDWIGRFQRLFDIALPFRGEFSPAKRPRNTPQHVLRRLQYFFLNNREVLNSITGRSMMANDTLLDRDKRMQWLAEILDAEFERLSPQSNTNTPHKRSNKQSPAEEQGTGPSPSQFTGKRLRDALPPLQNSTETPRLRQTLIQAYIPTTTNGSALTSFATEPSSSFRSNVGTHGSDDEIVGTPDTETDFEDQRSPLKPRSSMAVRRVDSKIDQNPGFSLLADHGTAPVRNSLRPSGPPSANSLEDYRVRNIPVDTFTVLCKLPSWMLLHGLISHLECYRAIQAGYPEEDLAQNWKPRTIDFLHQCLSERNIKIERTPDVNLDRLSLHANLTWSRPGTTQKLATGKSPIFKLEMLAGRIDQSNSLHRKFGGHRFLSIGIPDISKPPPFMKLKGQEKHIENRILELFRRELDILGRKWSFLFLKKNNQKRTLNRGDGEKGGFRAVFFATSGKTNLKDSVSVMSVINWALPLQENKSQPACKASARLDLVISDTSKGYTFNPSEVAYNEGDIRAIDVSDKTVYDDNYFYSTQFDPPFSPTDREVNNDGCNVISPRVMDAMRVKLGWSHLPAVVQARVFGAKGLWFLDSNDKPILKPGNLIALSKSQIKVSQIAANFGPGFDPECLTMNVVKHSHSARSSVLYLNYIPILADRGVSKASICAFAERMSKLEVEDFKSSVTDTSRLRYWVQKQNVSIHDNDSSRGVSKFFTKSAQTVARMLESGFKPTECLYLANEILSLGKMVFTLNKKSFRIPVPQSTMVFGIADPFGCLKPNEIHLQFSEPIKDNSSGHSFSSVEGKDALVARNPALRNSDIQRVRGVYRPELAHLLDVVVFPTAAKRSLAGKLQGGDYDGDIFWICWQPELVKDFKNAPAPWKLPEPEKYHITVDRTTLGERLPYENRLHPDEDACEDWLIESARSKFRENLLGQVTLLHGKIIYHQNDINSPAARALVDLHDHLVDSEKQGYRFGYPELSRFKKDHNIKGNYTVPAYRRFLEDRSADFTDKASEYSDARSINIIDHILFNVVEVILNDGLIEVNAALTGTSTIDASLAKFYDNTITRVGFGKAHDDLMALKSKLQRLVEQWYKSANESKFKKISFCESVAKCRVLFDEIVPDHPDDERVGEWTQHTGSEPTTWELLKASAAMKFCHKVAEGKMIFSVLGYELCILKARMKGPTREITSDTYANMKFRAPRTVVEEVGDEDSSEVSRDDESDYGSDDWCNYIDHHR